MKKLLAIFLCLVVIVAIFTVAKKDKEPDAPTAEITGETSMNTPADEILHEIKIGYFKEKSLNPYKTDSPLNRNLSTLVYDSLFVVEQGVQPCVGQQSAGVDAPQVQGVGTGGIFYGTKDQIGQIQADPVEHDAGNDHVDVALGFQPAGDGTQQGAGNDGADHA